MSPPDSDSVVVRLSPRPYHVKIAAGALSAVGHELRALDLGPRTTVVTDAHVGPLHADRLVRGLERAGLQHAVLTVPAGDASKSLEQVGRLFDELAALRHRRDEPLIALGGGMVGDLAGFTAATWLRGVPFVQCPTSLEADIDASIGGKTAVNHAAGKNLIGAFYQPVVVVIDTDCLATLPQREYVSALAESVKHAVIDGPAFLEWHERHADAILARDPAIVRELIRRNCRIKADIVEADERETDSHSVGRAALNLGHTIGHAIEAAAGYALRHGECVSLGLVAELNLAAAAAGLARADAERVGSLLARLGLPTIVPHPLDLAAIIDHLTADKKNRGGRIRLVVPEAIGTVRWLIDPADDALTDAVRAVSPTA